ncbi:MAG TPA: porin family protein, partial [bacterium]
QIDLSKPLTPVKERKTKFGIIGGMNLANFSGDEAKDSKSKTGFAAGGFVTFNLSEKLAIQPEILYSTKGAKYEDSQAGMKIKATTSLNYLDIPVLGVFSPVNNIKLFAGPSINIFLDGKSDAEIHGAFEQKYSEDIKSKDVNSPEFGLVVGGAFSSGQLNLGARYSMGFTNQPKNDEVDLKNRVIQFMLGVSF